MDFNTFENGMQPERLIQQYMRGKVSKVNQVNVSVHGADTWTGRVWQSLKWGSPSSPVSTKLYNKSKEMQQCLDKPYIAAMAGCRLDLTKDVWRVEFSLSAQMQSLKGRSNRGKCSGSHWHFMTAVNAYYNNGSSFIISTSISANSSSTENPTGS